MTKTFSKTILASIASAVLMATSAAHAATSIDATGFSLNFLGDEMGHPFDMTVLSDTNGTVRIGLNVGMSSPYVLDAFLHGGGSNGDYTAHMLAGAVKQGYRITSLTLSGIAMGDLFVEEPSVCGGCDLVWQGYARNDASLGLYVTPDGLPTVSGSDAVHDLDGSAALQAGVAAPLGGAFGLEMRAFQSVAAEQSYVTFSGPDHTGDYYYNARSTVGLEDVVLTVQVSAVPEPSTYGMLLAGLGVAGWAARRRRA